MIVKTVWQGRRAFVAAGDSGHPIRMDAPAAIGGEGSGATPMELVLAGLAGCIGIDLTMILNQFLGDIRRLEIEAVGTRKETPPKGFTAVEVIFRVDGDIPEYRLRKAIEMGLERYCSVAGSLKADIRYRLILNGAETVA